MHAVQDNSANELAAPSIKTGSVSNSVAGYGNQELKALGTS